MDATFVRKPFAPARSAATPQPELPEHYAPPPVSVHASHATPAVPAAFRQADSHRNCLARLAISPGELSVHLRSARFPRSHFALPRFCARRFFHERQLPAFPLRHSEQGGVER